MGRHFFNIVSTSFRIPLPRLPTVQTHPTFRFCCFSRSLSNSSSEPAPNEPSPHTPVFVKEVVQFFNGRSVQVLVDCTLGAGGHSTALLQEHPEVTCFLGIDADPTALEISSAKLQQLPAVSPPWVHLFNNNFSELERLLLQANLGVEQSVDGIILDLGMSSMQVDNPDRGFSFMDDGPLDMRMDTSAALTAEEIVNTWSEIDLGRIFREYGEEKMWRTVAKRVCDAREELPICSTSRLVDVVGNTVVGKSRHKRKKKIHPATRVFQALRIAVNSEMENLEKVLPRAINALTSGGRLCVISFHSLEDRIVKHAFMRAAGRTPIISRMQKAAAVHPTEPFDGRMGQVEGAIAAKILTKKPVSPSEEERHLNTRSRSAKLRCLEKI